MKQPLGNTFEANYNPELFLSQYLFFAGGLHSPYPYYIGLRLCKKPQTVISSQFMTSRSYIFFLNVKKD